MMSSQAPVRLYRVCWSSFVGRAVGRGRPMPKEQAEFVARDEELGHPLQRYWIEVCDEDPADGARDTARMH